MTKSKLHFALMPAVRVSFTLFWKFRSDLRGKFVRAAANLLDAKHC